MQKEIKEKKKRLLKFGTHSKTTAATCIAQSVLFHVFLPYGTICLQQEYHNIIRIFLAAIITRKNKISEDLDNMSPDDPQEVDTVEWMNGLVTVML